MNFQSEKTNTTRRQIERARKKRGAAQIEFQISEFISSLADQIMAANKMKIFLFFGKFEW